MFFYATDNVQTKHAKKKDIGPFGVVEWRHFESIIFVYLLVNGSIEYMHHGPTAPFMCFCWFRNI